MSPDHRANVHIITTAFHEAGHTVAALKAGRYVEYLYISRKKPGNGFTLYHKLDIYNPFYPGSTYESVLTAWNFALNNIKKEMSVLLAGPLAEAKYLNLPLRSLGAISDLDKCQNLANRVDVLYGFYNGFYSIPLCEGYKVMNQMRVSTRRWLGQPKTWNTIKLLAELAIEVNVLNSAQICYLVGKANESEHQRALNLY